MSLVGALICGGLSTRRTAAVRKALQPFLPLELRGINLMRLGNYAWDPLVPVSAKWDYLLSLVFGCAGGALLTLALYGLRGWGAPAVFTGILTGAGIIQAIVSAVKYRMAASALGRANPRIDP